jgi:endonuclease/exonuclease/phosphatase family metal-dependent hydrolase
MCRKEETDSGDPSEYLGGVTASMCWVPYDTDVLLNHVFVSPQFTVERCEIWNGRGDTPDGLGPSDHAPVYAELQLDG